jgi:predicted dehydrogenase
MTNTVRWGILSTANIGRNKVIPAIHASNNGEVVAVASRSLASAQAFADEMNIPQAYGSYEELINADIVDAIYIPLPNTMHAEWSIKCAQAGIPTLCEKPFASDAPEAQSIVDAFEQHGVLLAEAFMYRFHPQHAKVKEIIADGGIGDLMSITSNFTFRLTDEANIRLSKTLAGGSLMDVGCYCINVMRFMTGEEPEDIKATARIGDVTGVDEVLAGTLKFPSGVIGHFDSGLRSYRENSYTLRGTLGKITLPVSFVPDGKTDTIVQHWHGDDYTEHIIPAIDQYKLMVEDFADALLNNRAPRFMPSDAVRNMEVIDKMIAQVN